jgi:glycosyltransferase involved in cell wall biosynthesis
VITVAIDLRRASWRPELGLSRYARSLLNAMLELRPADVRFAPVDLAGSERWLPENPILLPSGRGFARRAWQDQVSMLVATRTADLLHLPWYEGPLHPVCPWVVSVFDLDTIVNPHSYRWRFRAYYNTLLRAHVRRARAVIVSSWATRAALEDRWPNPRYVVIPLGVDSVFFERPEPQATADAPYILYTGGFSARKRLDDLFEAFDQVSEAERDVRLTLTGDGPAEVRHAAAKHRSASRIRFTGRVSDERLAELYRQAEAVVYPSALEGFGFPVVEAFASGTPVVATAAGSIPEVAGDAAYLVPPERPTELADALLEVLGNAGLRDRLTAAGHLRAQKFTWSEAAGRTLDVYREAAS